MPVTEKGQYPALDATALRFVVAGRFAIFGRLPKTRIARLEQEGFVTRGKGISWKITAAGLDFLQAHPVAPPIRRRPIPRREGPPDFIAYCIPPRIG